MEKYIKLLSLFLLIFLLCSCPAQPVIAPNTNYEKDAIHLTLRSDPKLNYYEGMPHTLFVCVYQLRDPNAYNQLTSDEDGIYKLLDCSLFDISVVSSKRLTVYPGQDLETFLDRAEGARYVAVVAGYYYMRKERLTRLFEIPVVQKSKGFLWRQKYQVLGPLNIELMMGPEQIHSSHSEERQSEEGQ